MPGMFMLSKNIKKQNKQIKGQPHWKDDEAHWRNIHPIASQVSLQSERQTHILRWDHSLPLLPSSSSRCLLEVSLKHWPRLLLPASPWQQASLLPSKDDCDDCSTSFGCLLFFVQIYFVTFLKENTCLVKTRVQGSAAGCESWQRTIFATGTPSPYLWTWILGQVLIDMAGRNKQVPFVFFNISNPQNQIKRL